MSAFDRRFIGLFTTWPDVARMILAVKKLIQPAPAVMVYAPGTQLSTSLTSSLAAVDSTNVKITVPAIGSSGILIIEADLYYEITTSDTILARMTGGTNSSNDVIIANGAIGNHNVHHTWVITGLTPGASFSSTLYHQFRTATGAGALKAGGSGSTLRPPVVLKATTF